MKKRIERNELARTLGGFAVVELDDASLEDIWGGEEDNCGCHGGECNEVEGCGTDINTVAGCACPQPN